MAEYPAINGFAPSWASVEISILGEITSLVKGVEYSNARSRGMGRGPSGRKRLRTQGDDEPEASITFFQQGFDDLVDKLSAAGLGQTPQRGWQDVEFEVVVNWERGDGTIATRTLERCLVDEFSESGEEGEDPIEVECTLNVMDVVVNGKRGRLLPTS